MKIAEHCKNCIYCLDYVKAGLGSEIIITKENKIRVTPTSSSFDWHPSLILCNPDNDKTPTLRKNIRSCSRFNLKSGTYLNKNIWVDIYAKEN